MRREGGREGTEGMKSPSNYTVDCLKLRQEFVVVVVVVPGNILRSGGHFETGLVQPLLGGLDCTGGERSLLDCPQDGYGSLLCNNFQNAGVTCNGSYSDCTVNIRYS